MIFFKYISEIHSLFFHLYLKIGPSHHFQLKKFIKSNVFPQFYSLNYFFFDIHPNKLLWRIDENDENTNISKNSNYDVTKTNEQVSATQWTGHGSHHAAGSSRQQLSFRLYYTYVTYGTFWHIKIGNTFYCLCINWREAETL